MNAAVCFYARRYVYKDGWSFVKDIKIIDLFQGWLTSQTVVDQIAVPCFGIHFYILIPLVLSMLYPKMIKTQPEYCTKHLRLNNGMSKLRKLQILMIKLTWRHCVTSGWPNMIFNIVIHVMVSWKYVCWPTHHLSPLITQCSSLTLERPAMSG